MNEILLEYREILDRYSHYGAWIDANTGQVIPIDGQGGHADYIKANLKKFGVPPQYITSPQDYYTIGFAHNLVRVVHKPTSSLNVEGMANDLKKVAKIIMASAVQDDVNEVIVSKYNNLDQTERTSGKPFLMPRDRTALMQYIS